MSGDGDLLVCVGVDGGGTTTRVRLVDCSSGAAIGETGLGGCSNANSVGAATAEQNLTTAFHAALASLPSGQVTVAGMLLSMSGADRADDALAVRQWAVRAMRSFGGDTTQGSVRLLDDDEQRRIQVGSDALAAFLSGAAEQELFGAVVISGTGMVVFAYADEHTSSRAGGWGPLLGEPGSGYSIGSAVLKATTRAVDGTGPATQLSQAVLDRLGLQSAQQLIPWTYSDISWSRFAALAPLAFQLYGADQVATQLIDNEVELLLDTLEAALRHVALPRSFPVVCSGGNFTHPDSVLYAVFARRFALRQAASPLLAQARLCLPAMPAELAAALYAYNKHYRRP